MIKKSFQETASFPY